MIALIGAMFVNVGASIAYGDPDANAYEILFSRVLDHPGDAALNKQFARDAEARAICVTPSPPSSASC